MHFFNYKYDLPVMYWIPKMHKNPISFCFIIASPAFSIKPFPKDTKLFYEKVKRYHTKGNVWSGIKTLSWIIQSGYPVFPSIKLKKRKAAKSVSTFDL